MQSLGLRGADRFLKEKYEERGMSPNMQTTEGFTLSVPSRACTKRYGFNGWHQSLVLCDKTDNLKLSIQSQHFCATL
jgi:hypothetical protein